MSNPSPLGSPQIRERALAITVGLGAVVIALAGHQYFTSPKARARRLLQAAAEHPAAQVLVPLGCQEALVLTPAESAQLAHITGETLTETVTNHAVVCKATAARAPSCQEVVAAYEAAHGPSPATIAVAVDGNLRCSQFFFEPTAKGAAETIPIPPAR